MKRNWLYVIVIVAVTLTIVPAGVRAAPTGNGVPILYYDFENNTTRTTFENLVEQAINSGSGAITRAGNTTAITGVGGAGTFNGGAATGQALTGNNWQNITTTDPGGAATDYYQFVVNTTGFSQLSISFDNQASATGPARVGVLYSTDGSTFAATTTALTGNAAFATATFDLTGISAVDNQSSVTIRLYAYAGTASDRTGRSTFGATGTFRIDNLTVFAKTATASVTLLDYPAIGLSIKSGTAFTPIYTDSTISGVGVIVTLASNLNLTGTLTLTSGDLNTNGNLLTLGGNASVTGSGDVVGTVRRTSPATGSNLTFNNAQTMINFASAPDQMDVTLVKAAPGTFTYALPRTFTLTPGVGTINAAVQLAYKPAEISGGATESKIVLWRYNTENSTWENLGGTVDVTGDGTWHWVSQSGITQFSSWTVSGFTPTAVTVRDLTASSPASPAPMVLGVFGLFAGGLLLRRRTLRTTPN